MTNRLSAMLLAALALPAAARGQVKASEPASVSQTIDGTKITIEYSRPRARNREALFGKIVHWNETWTPGANSATTLEVSKDMKLNGRRVPKGKYSVWMVVRTTGPWTVALDTNNTRWHLPHPDTTGMLVRFPVTPEVGPQTDVLTWAFPTLRVSGATITMQWGTTRVPLEVEVESSLKIATPAAAAAAYVGRYLFPDTRDTTTTRALIVTYEDSVLKGRWEPHDEYMGRFALIKSFGEGSFVPGLYDRHGQIYELLRPNMTLQFKIETGKAVSVEMRDQEDKVGGVGKRQG